MSNARAVIDARVWLALSWLSLAVLAAALIVLLALGWRHEFLMACCFFFPFLLGMLLPHGLPNLLMAVISGCFLVSAGGWALDWYSHYWWFDVVLHALNPFAMMAGTMVMLWKADLVGVRPPGRFVLVSTVLGLILGIGWELVELTFLVLTWPDTILDIVMDTAGSALGGWFALWMIRARGLAPLGRRQPAARSQGQLQAVPARVSSRR